MGALGERRGWLRIHGLKVAELKKSAVVYPEQLKQALVSKFLCDANFMLELARSTASRDDVFHVSGCLFRCAAALVQVLFALNETYFMNEKGAVSTADSFSIKPPSFSSRITGILSRPGELSDALQARVDEMASLISETSFLQRQGHDGKQSAPSPAPPRRRTRRGESPFRWGGDSSFPRRRRRGLQGTRSNALIVCAKDPGPGDCAVTQHPIVELL